MRRGEPMGVQIGDDGFPNYLAARPPASRPLADFLEQLELENFGPAALPPNDAMQTASARLVVRSFHWP
jgi:hypothetical protein